MPSFNPCTKVMWWLYFSFLEPTSHDDDTFQSLYSRHLTMILFILVANVLWDWWDAFLVSTSCHYDIIHPCTSVLWDWWDAFLVSTSCYNDIIHPKYQRHVMLTDGMRFLYQRLVIMMFFIQCTSVMWWWHYSFWLLMSCDVDGLHGNSATHRPEGESCTCNRWKAKLGKSTWSKIAKHLNLPIAKHRLL